jgi:preprotein translocase subunit SecE
VADQKEKKPNRIVRFFRETMGELRKVSWPTTHEAWGLTKIVLIVLAAMGLLLGVLDFVFSWVITRLLA